MVQNEGLTNLINFCERPLYKKRPKLKVQKKQFEVYSTKRKILEGQFTT
jgi:hypothetical protein